MAPDLLTCNCGQTYNPEISASVCPSCGDARSLTKHPDESREGFAARLNGEGGKELEPLGKPRKE